MVSENGFCLPLSVKTIIMLIIGIIFVYIGISTIYTNTKIYDEYAKSSDIRKVEAKVTDVEVLTIYTTESQEHNDIETKKKKHKTDRIKKESGKKYTYHIEYNINDKVYKDTIYEHSDYNNKIEPMKIGDTREIEVYKNKNGIYQVPKIKSLEYVKEQNLYSYIMIVVGIFICIAGFWGIRGKQKEKI